MSALGLYLSRAENSLLDLKGKNRQKCWGGWPVCHGHMNKDWRQCATYLLVLAIETQFMFIDYGVTKKENPIIVWTSIFI